MLFEVLILVAALAILAKSSNLVSDKSVMLAEYLGISQMAIGFILISASTSIPELAIAIISASSGQGALSAGNVFGANVTDVLGVAGICALVYGLRLSRKNLADVAAVILATTAIMVYFVYSSFVLGSPTISSKEGVVFVLAFFVYVSYVLRKKKLQDGNNLKATKQQAAQAFVIFFFGIFLVLVSSSFVVDYAVRISEASGLSKSLIGGTIIALGTTLPELSVAIASMRKRRHELALGNVLGSTVINMTLVLGVGALINTIVIGAPTSFLMILLFAIFSNLLVFYFLLIRKEIGQAAGAFLLALYVLYVILLIYSEGISSLAQGFNSL